MVARGGVSMYMGTVKSLSKGMFEFVWRVVRQGEGCPRPCRFGVEDCTEASVFGVVGDVGLSTEGEADWIAVDESLDIKAEM